MPFSVGSVYPDPPQKASQSIKILLLATQIVYLGTHSKGFLPKFFIPLKAVEVPLYDLDLWASRKDFHSAAIQESWRQASRKCGKPRFGMEM